MHNSSLFARITFLITLAGSISATASGEAPTLPELSWEPRADWINVKTSVQPAAKGDGAADDTDAIQAALNRLADGVTIYFPPGIYRITHTLKPPTGRYLGVSLIGHGRTTTLAWDGEVGGRMFWTNDGMAYTRYVGLSWDGRGKAAVGFDHACLKIFETEVRHEHEAYRNFTESGIRIGHAQRVATAETVYANCLFEHCGHGITIHDFNDLDHTVEECEFRQCGVGVYGGKGSNFYVRNTHFEQSSESDIVCRGEQGSSVRRSTSHGSNAFLAFGSSVGPLIIQDCHVDAWTGKQDAITLNGAPVLIFDCVFTNPPASQSAVRAERPEQKLILSNNQEAGAPLVARMPEGGKPVEVPPGALGGVVKSAAQTFLKSKVRIAGKVFDVKRDFGARGDGSTDDTDAINRAIDAAKAAGHGAIAYLPPGRFAVTKTLSLTGSDYALGGSGFRTALVWNGKPDGITLEVRDPDRIVVQDIAMGHHDAGANHGAIDIVQNGSGKPSSITYDRVWVWGGYQSKPLEHGLRMVNLGKQDRVYFREVDGNLHFTDCAQATIYLGVSYEGTIMVEGKSPERGGFLGGSVRLATITDPGLWIKDNQSIVMSDHYVESSLHLIRMQGGAALPPGRVTLQGAKFELVKPENNAVEVEDYRGELFLGPYQFYVGNPIHHFVQQGDSPFALTLVGGLFYNSKPEFRLAPTASLGVVACESVVLNKSDAIDRVRGVVNTSLPDALPRIARGLDDLRRLGAVDLEMNEGK